MFRIAIQGSLTDAEKLTDIIRKNEFCLLSGICKGLNDPEQIENKFSDHPFRVFNNVKSIIPLSDAIIFLDHQDETVPLVKLCLKESRHVFISPSTPLSPDLLKEYYKLADEAGVILYLYHKPDLGKLRELVNSRKNPPEFMDVYRYVIQGMNDQGCFINTLQDEILYLHSLIQFPVKKFKVATVPYSADRPYIINIRMDFSNGTSANLTINTFTGLESRFSEFYFSDGIIQVNTMEQSILEKFWKTDETYKYNQPAGLLNERNPSQEISTFLYKINNLSFPLNNIEYGYNIYHTIWDLIKTISPASLLI